MLLVRNLLGSDVREVRMSDRCDYCQHSGFSSTISIDGEVKRPNHDKFCPNNSVLQIHPVLVTENLLFLKSERQRSIAFWNKGWDDGRQAVEPKTDNETYMLGWLTGECAREEAENGCSWSEVYE
jgi:hypothetical protein